jgi:hypothetical protein
MASFSQTIIAGFKKNGFALEWVREVAAITPGRLKKIAAGEREFSNRELILLERGQERTLEELAVDVLEPSGSGPLNEYAAIWAPFARKLKEKTAENRDTMAPERKPKAATAGPNGHAKRARPVRSVPASRRLVRR